MIPHYDPLNRNAPSPGVYIETAGRPDRDLFLTGVPLFIGFGASDEQHRPDRRADGGYAIHHFTRWEQFAQRIRIDQPEGYLDYAVRGFFQNGGQHCVVVCLDAQGHGGFAHARSLNTLFEPLRGPLEDIPDTDLVCAPDIMMRSVRSLPDMSREIQMRLLDFCRRMGDRFAILDSMPLGDGDRKSPLDRALLGRVRAERRALTLATSTMNRSATEADTNAVVQPGEGALYFPWLCVSPLPRHGTRRRVPVPPSGHVAGIYARSDRHDGVHKAPANEEIAGADDLEWHLLDDDLAMLNREGINCLRPFPGRGIRVWGARTLSPRRQWRYVNVRRLFLALIRWIDRHMDKIIFEPNDPLLWDRVSDHIGAYCYDLYNKGALKGSRPAEAYYVKCDAETNPPESMARGQLVCEVGLAPLVPAEFIVARLTQSHSGTTAYYLPTP